MVPRSMAAYSAEALTVLCSEAAQVVYCSSAASAAAASSSAAVMAACAAWVAVEAAVIRGAV